MTMRNTKGLHNFPYKLSMKKNENIKKLFQSCNLKRSRVISVFWEFLFLCGFSPKKIALMTLIQLKETQQKTCEFEGQSFKT